MSAKREYKYGDVVTMKREDSNEEIEYRIGSAIGDWQISLTLPGVGMCGLYEIFREAA